ncbi:MAG TPA: CaiB/BaiF CoA-transferase family protein, partial [Anaeromyxobacteraceae bacterium]|nr:CaiB/BaiF CoA-transferase family protein [Anaeromyxobacteraceae bacterium]
FDVVVESFRPGVMDRLGVGYAALKAEHPGVILCSISGYGQDGPYRDRAGHDIDYCATAGVLALNGPPEQPLPLGVQVADVAGGSWPAVAGVLAALVRRAATGEGSHVDVSMTDGALAMLALQLGAAAARGSPAQRAGEMLNGGSACYGVYRTRDGRFVALGALEPKFFRSFCEAAGRPELAERQFEDEGRGPRAELAALFATRTREEWARLGEAADCCLSPVLEGDEPARDPQLLARGLFLSVETPWEGRAMASLRTPVRFVGAEPAPRPAPRLGADGERVLAEAGFTVGEIENLRRLGILG